MVVHLEKQHPGMPENVLKKKAKFKNGIIFVEKALSIWEKICIVHI